MMSEREGVGRKWAILATKQRGFHLAEFFLRHLQGRGFQGNLFLFLSDVVECVIDVTALDETCHFPTS